MRLSAFALGLAALAVATPGCDRGGGDTQTVDSEPPPAPTGLSASPEPSAVELRWDPVEAEDLNAYRVYRRIQNRPSAQIATVGGGTTAFLDGSVQGGETYFYRVTAVDTVLNESGFSGEVSVTPLVRSDP